MLVLEKIKYQNLYSTGNTPIEIPFDQYQKLLLVGQNGAGKSTCLNVLSFVLFNRDLNGVNKPKLVNTINRKGALAETWLRTNGNRYHIRRGIKPDIFEIYENDKLLPQEAENRDYQKFLEKNILRLDYNSFKQIVILGSGNYVPFMRLDAKARRDFIEELLSLKVFSKMNVILKDRVSANTRRLQDIDNKITNEKNKLEILERNLNAIQAETEGRVAELTTEQQDLKNQNTNLSSKAETLEKEIEKLTAKLIKTDSVLVKKQEIERLIFKLQSEKTSFEKELRFYVDHDNCPTCKQIIDAGFKAEIVSEKNNVIDERRGQLSMLDQKLEKIKDALTKIREVENRRSTLVSEQAGYVNKISTNTSIMSRLSKEIENLTNNNDRKDIETKNISDSQERLKILYTTKDEINEERELLSTSVVLLKDNGIKAKILSAYIPLINNLVNSYLDKMDFYVNFQLDENFDETIKSRYRDELKYESFSMGEKQRIDLALLFTWRQIAHKKNSMNVNLLFMDEVADSSMDEDGIDCLMKILDGQTETNTVIISHRETILEHFNKTIRFKKVKNFSQIEELN